MKSNKINSIMGMAFFGPALVLLTLFLFLPMLLTVIFSFTDFFALNPDLTHFVGLKNYSDIFKDELFTTAFFNTVKFVLIIVPAQTLGALGLALLINKATVCKKYFKVAFFIPVVMSLAVVSNLWMQIYSPEGILNTMLAQIGIEAQPFIYSADQALPSIAIMSVWQGVGYQMIIFLGGLQAINPALYEAAEMDHAVQGHHLTRAETPLRFRFHHRNHRCIPNDSSAYGNDRRRSFTFHIHTCLRHLRNRYGKLGDRTCFRNGSYLCDIRYHSDYNPVCSHKG